MTTAPTPCPPFRRDPVAERRLGLLPPESGIVRLLLQVAGWGSVSISLWIVPWIWVRLLLVIATAITLPLVRTPERRADHGGRP